MKGFLKNRRVSVLIAAAILVMMAGILFAVVLAPNARVQNGAGIVLPGPGQVSAPPGNLTDFPKIDSGYSPVLVTRENVKGVIETISRPENYSYEIGVTYPETGILISLRAYVLGEYQKIERISETGEVLRHVITSGDKVYMWQSGSPIYYSGLKGEFSEDDYKLSPTYEDILKYDDRDVLHAEYVTSDSESYIHVQLSNEVSDGLSYIEHYYVDAKTGLLVRAEAYKDDVCIYRMEASAVDTAFLDFGRFVLPDGEQLVPA